MKNDTTRKLWLAPKLEQISMVDTTQKLVGMKEMMAGDLSDSAMANNS